MSDNLVDYLYDSLCWVPSANYSSRSSASDGLNLYGETVVTVQGANLLKTILAAWLSLFMAGPSTIAQTGHFVIEPDKEADGFYENIHFEKIALIEELTAIILLCEEAANSDGEKLILHLGI